MVFISLFVAVVSLMGGKYVWKRLDRHNELYRYMETVSNGENSHFDPKMRRAHNDIPQSLFQ
jgi:hypothetical protein